MHILKDTKYTVKLNISLGKIFLYITLGDNNILCNCLLLISIFNFFLQFSKFFIKLCTVTGDKINTLENILKLYQMSGLNLDFWYKRQNKYILVCKTLFFPDFSFRKLKVCIIHENYIISFFLATCLTIFGTGWLKVS